MTTLAAPPQEVPVPSTPRPGQPIGARGKFLFAADAKFYIRGVTYGPFAPGDHGEYGSPEQVRRDFRLMRQNSINTARIYTLPPDWLMDEAADAGLRVLVGVPWAQHLPFLERREHMREARASVRAAAERFGKHPALLAISVGNEIPSGVVRWYGHRAIEQALASLCQEAKEAAPEALLTYVNYPPTEYLDLPFLDLVAFNVFLERRDTFERYIARLQNIAGDRPLIMTEIGLDSLRNGAQAQADSVAWQVRSSFECGAAGAIVFSWTDDWFRGGSQITDWAFGLTDRHREPKPALDGVRREFDELPCRQSTLPRASVVICSYNGSRTIRRTLEHVCALDYPDFEVIVVDDGSRDAVPDIAAEFPVRLIRTENRGLSSARNTGAEAATGEIVAYIDDDAHPDPHWLQYLARTLQDGHAGAGGPNLAIPSDGWVVGCINSAPGNPTHVLLSDTIAEHVPGCNMAYWKWALEAVGGFDTQFRIAGDDVDLCWRLQERGWTLGFSSAAMVWHHRRQTVRAFWRQQRNYGRAEADLERKWPEKYNAVGHATWTGRVYGGANPALLVPERRSIYHGVWGVALFQHVYPTRHSFIWSLPLMPEWYAVLAALGLLSAASLVWTPLRLFVPAFALMFAFAAAQALVHGARARFPVPPGTAAGAVRMRLLVAFLYMMQPVARLTGRLHNGLTPLRLRGMEGFAFPFSRRLESWCKHWHDPAARLASLEGALKDRGAVVLRGHEFARWDLELRAGLFGRVRISQFTADLAHSAQYVQVRANPRIASLGSAIFLVSVLICAAAVTQEMFLLAAISWLIAAAVVALCLRELSAAMAAVERTAAQLLKDAPP